MRNLRPDEIECRVNKISDKGLSLLLYKNARTDMNILDEAYADKWACEYKEIKGNLFCGISVKINEEWVTRWDCGVESREDGNGNEKKGEASDSFKRAGTKWGIGRELYTAPKSIWINAGDCKVIEAGKDKYGNPKLMTYDTFSVTEIGTENGTITSLKIINDKTKKIVYVLGSGVKPAPKQTPADVEKAGKEFFAKFNELNNKLSNFLNMKGLFDHPDIVRQFVAAKDIKNMEAAVAQAEKREAEQKKKEEQKKQAEQEAKPEQLPIF